MSAVAAQQQQQQQQQAQGDGGIPIESLPIAELGRIKKNTRSRANQFNKEL